MRFNVVTPYGMQIDAIMVINKQGMPVSITQFINEQGHIETTDEEIKYGHNKLNLAFAASLFAFFSHIFSFAFFLPS